MFKQLIMNILHTENARFTEVLRSGPS